MDSPYGFDMGNVLMNVDAIRTARLRNTLAERQLADEEKARADEAKLQAARTGAFRGDKVAMAELVGLAPGEAVQFMSYFDGLDEKKRAAAVAEAEQNIELSGRMAAWVKAQPDPAAAWAEMRANLPPEVTAKMPKEYSPGAVDMMLARTMSMDQLLEEAKAGKSREAFNSAFETAPRGTQGAITPSANPQGLNPRIVGAVDSENALIQNESGGNWSAQNDAVGSGGRVGHFGRAQFGMDRLDDAKRAGVMPQWMTPEQFMADPTAQKKVEDWHFGDIRQDIRAKGLDRFVGQTLNGIPITEQGMVNVAHLGGKAGLARFLETGGQYDPADANGTHLSDYLALGAKDAPQIDPGVERLMRAAGDPALDDQQRAILRDAITLLQPKEGPTWRPLTPAEAATYGVAAGQIDTKTGKVQPINPPSGMTVFGPDGNPIVQTGPGQNPFTEGQSKNVIYATRAKGALPTLDAFGDALTSFSQTAAGAVPMNLGRLAQTPEYQRAQQAGDEFLQAVLRKDTGAAITPAEMQEYGRTYLPQPGDTPEVLAQKKDARARAVQAMENGMTAQEILATERSSAAPAAPAMPVETNSNAAPQTGVRYRYNAETDALEPM